MNLFQFFGPVLATFFFCCPIVLANESFRVDNTVQRGGRTPLVASSVFFLPNGNFISIIENNGEIILYEKTAEIETFVLLDPVLRIQTHLDARQTRENADKQRIRYKNHNEPFLAFVAQPNFQRENDASSGSVSLQSPWFDYRLETETLSDKKILDRYYDFCDLSCYLNYRLNPASPIPLVRLAVNDILRQTNRFPKTIGMSFHPKGKSLFLKEEKMRSSHKMIHRLDDSDQKKIDQVFEYKRAFGVVPFDDYQKKVVDKAQTR